MTLARRMLRLRYVLILAFGALLIGRLARADIFHVQPHFILLLLIILL